MKSSMSRKGNCWDNAPTESLWGSLKVGRLHGMRFETRRQAMDEVIDWLTFYNHRRLHSTLGYVSPMQCKRSFNPAPCTSRSIVMGARSPCRQAHAAGSTIRQGSRAS